MLMGDITYSKKKLYVSVNDNLNKYPPPSKKKRAPHKIFSFFNFLVYSSPEIHKKIAELSKEYGPVVQVSFGNYLLLYSQIGSFYFVIVL